MKLNIFNKILGTSLIIGSTLMTQTAMGAAGEIINNLASISYSVDNVAQTSIESSPTGNSNPGTGNGTNTEFVEDQVINFAVVAADSSEVPVAPEANSSAVTGYLAFTVYNLGDGQTNTTTDNPGSNGTVTVSLATNDLVAATANPFTSPTGDANDGFNATSCAVYSDTAGTVLPSNEVELAAGANTTVYVACAVPVEIGGANGGANLEADDITVVNLVGTVVAGYTGTQITTVMRTNATANDLMKVEYVFADADSGDSEDGAAYNGIHSDRSAYKIIKPDLTITKTATVISDPVCDADPACTNATHAKAIPGAVIDYTIIVKNTGTTTAESVVISDTLVTADVTYDAAQSFDNTTGSVTTADVNYATPTITANCGDLAQNDECTLVFRVTVNY